MKLLKLSFNQNLIMINQKSNDKFNSYVIFKVTQDRLIVLLYVLKVLIIIVLNLSYIQDRNKGINLNLATLIEAKICFIYLV
jgi:hypothetical protein